MVKLHPKLMELVVKSYRHAHGGDEYLVDLLGVIPLSKQFQVKKKYHLENQLLKFLNSLSIEDSLKVIEDTLDDTDIKQMEHDNWNYYGDFVREWRARIISLLGKSGINYDEKTKRFYKDNEPMEVPLGFRVKDKFISSIFQDSFNNALKEEINQSYRAGVFTGVIILSRKMIENLVIDILRLKFPPNKEENLELYFRKGDGRFHDFTILLKNLESRKKEFELDKETIEEFFKSVKPFRLKANSKAHSIVMVGEEKELLDCNIEKMVELLLKLKNHLLNDSRL